MAISRVYRLFNNLYGALPNRFSISGHAFPAWHYDFEVTLRCNFQCAMCQFQQIPNAQTPAQLKEKELTAREWFDVIDQVPGYGLITFTGGEPFVRGDFMSILEHACARRRTHFITNGSLLTPDRIDHILDWAPKRLTGIGLTCVGISIDGPREVHDRIRADGSFERAISAVRDIRAGREQRGKRAPLVHVTSVIQEANLDTLAQMPAIVRDAGADIYNLTLEIRMFELDGLGVQDPWSFSKDQFSLPRLDRGKVLRMLAEVRTAAAAMGLQLRLPGMPDEQIARYYDGGMALSAYRCRAVWSDLVVDSAGDLYLACRIRSIGNVRRRRLKETWNSIEARQLRRGIRRGLPAACAGCCYLEYR